MDQLPAVEVQQSPLVPVADGELGRGPVVAGDLDEVDQVYLCQLSSQDVSPIRLSSIPAFPPAAEDTLGADMNDDELNRTLEALSQETE